MFYIIPHSLYRDLGRLFDISRRFSDRTSVLTDFSAAFSFGHAHSKYSAAYVVRHHRSRSRSSETCRAGFRKLRDVPDTYTDRQRSGFALRSPLSRRTRSRRSETVCIVTCSLHRDLGRLFDVPRRFSVRTSVLTDFSAALLFGHAYSKYSAVFVVHHRRRPPRTT